MEKRITITSKGVELIYSNRICCYDDESIDLAIKLTGKKEDELKLGFLFKYSDDQKPKVEPSGNVETGIIFKLTNFSSPFGMGLKKPIAIAKLDERTIYLLFNVYKNGDANPIIDLSLYLENAHAN